MRPLQWRTLLALAGLFAVMIGLAYRSWGSGKVTIEPGQVTVLAVAPRMRGRHLMITESGSPVRLEIVAPPPPEGKAPDPTPLLVYPSLTPSELAPGPFALNATALGTCTVANVTIANLRDPYLPLALVSEGTVAAVPSITAVNNQTGLDIALFDAYESRTVPAVDVSSATLSLTLDASLDPTPFYRVELRLYCLG